MMKAIPMRLLFSRHFEDLFFQSMSALSTAVLEAHRLLARLRPRGPKLLTFKRPVFTKRDW